MKIWENLFTDVCGTHFHLFFALAILQAHRDITMRYLQSFGVCGFVITQVRLIDMVVDELLKYINELR